MEAKAFTEALSANFSLSPTADQQQAMALMGAFVADDNSKKTFILKGYAGTGKTTLIRALTKTFGAFEYKIVLLAPTGRAAKVVSEYAGRSASTIHRHIYDVSPTKEGSLAVKHAKNDKEKTVFIVDEASMVSNKEDGAFFRGARLLDDLFNYVHQGTGCFLIFVGDTAQLPPVHETVSPALDPKHIEKEYDTVVYTCEMKEVVRQQKASGILMNATALRVLINRGEKMPILKTIGFPDVVNLLKENLEEELAHYYGNKKIDESLIVCRSNRTANRYNQFIRNRLFNYEDEVCSGDRMMVVKNNYFWLEPWSIPGFIANGDILKIKKIRRTEERYGFRFAEAIVEFVDYPEEGEREVKLLLDVINSETPSLTQTDSKKLFDAVYADYADEKKSFLRMKKVYADPFFNALQVKFSYAVTCHKAQGGQWENVIVDPGYMTDDMFNTEYLRWLYTAVTRATLKLSFVEMDERFFRQE